MTNRKRSSPDNNEREERLLQVFKSFNRDRLRVIMPDNCIKLLEEIKNSLNLRFLGLAVDWMLPGNMKGLVELTEEMGYDNGVQTIDWLLKMGMETNRIVNFKQELDSQTDGQTVNLSLPRETRPLVELTRELGFNKGGETVDWLLEMATNPMLRLINILGFKDGAKTIDWLLDQAKPSIKAATMNRFNPHKSPTISSAMNIPSLFPPKQPETPAPNPPEKKPQFYIFNAQPHQFQSTGQQLVEKQQQAQFDNNGSRPQAEYQSFNGNGGLSNRSKGVKRRRKRAVYSNHGGNRLQSQYLSGHPGSQSTAHIERTANSAQGLSQNPINGVDVACVQGFQGMPLEIHVQNNSVIMGNTCQQNVWRQFRHPKALLDYYFANYKLFENIHDQNQFENILTQNQNQFVNIHEQNQNHDQFVNIHEQNQDHFVSIHQQNQNQFVNIYEQNQNQFINIHEYNLNQFLNTQGQNQVGTEMY